MVDYSLLDLRRFSSDVLPFLCILVVGELRGDNTNAFDFFINALSNHELRDIAADQKNSKQKRYCMYLVNFHDYIEAALHANLEVSEQDIDGIACATDLTKVRKLLTHFELAPDSDFDELCKEMFENSVNVEDSNFNLLLRCLHMYFMHLLVLNIELQRAKNIIVRKVSGGPKEKLLAAVQICVAPELPTYLIRALQVANKYCTGPVISVNPVDIESTFVRETNIGYNMLTSLEAYKYITPLVDAYSNTLYTIRDTSSSVVDICNCILLSEIWREERSISL